MTQPRWMAQVVRRSWPLAACLMMAGAGVGCAPQRAPQAPVAATTQQAIAPRIPSMVTSRYVFLSFDPAEGWTCSSDGPEGSGTLRGRTWSFDFSRGAKSIGLIPADISMLGEPQELRLRFRGNTRGHRMRLQLITHFMTFERTLEAIEGDGPHEIVIPAPPGEGAEGAEGTEGWRWFGGENDGKIHGPLRIMGLFLDAVGQGGAGQLELLDIQVVARCAANRTSLLTAELRSGSTAPQFVGRVQSLAPEPLPATLTCVIRDWEGRTVASQSQAVHISASQPTEFAVPVPAGDHAFLEAEFTCQAEGQEIPAVTVCHLAPLPPGGSDTPEPQSPFGMGLYLYRYDDPALMERGAQMAQDIGVKWSREEFSWSAIEPRKGQFDWTHYDRVLATAKRHGISVYGLLDYWSRWTTPYTPEGIEDYCRYVRAVVERYRGDIHHWEVWNEPNIFFWQGPKDMYADLLKAAYRTIKEVDPTALVAGCSTSGIDMPFIARTMELGGPFDILTIHPYRRVLDDRKLIDELRQAAALVKTADGQARPVWITEFGWGTHIQHNALHEGPSVSPRQQACLLTRVYLDALASGVAPNISSYDFRNDGTNLLEWEHNFGMITRDFQPKPAFRAFATLTALLRGRQIQEELALGADTVGFRFARPDASDAVVVLWTIQQPQTISLPATGPTTLTSLMGESRELPVEAGMIRLDLQPGIPVFVTSRK